jgi:hypothetical protein
VILVGDSLQVCFLVKPFGIPAAASHEDNVCAGVLHTVKKDGRIPPQPGSDFLRNVDLRVFASVRDIA